VRIRRGGQAGGHPLQSMAHRPHPNNQMRGDFSYFGALPRRCRPMIWSVWVLPCPPSPLHDFDAVLLLIPCSAALCTALSKQVVEVSVPLPLVTHLAEAAGRGCWSGNPFSPGASAYSKAWVIHLVHPPRLRYPDFGNLGS